MSTALALPDISAARLPAAYEHAKAALAACCSVDECKDWSDKAEALASYARQSEDDTLFRHAMRIRGRAIRRCGELLKTFQNQGKRTDLLHSGVVSSQREAAAQAGMSTHQEADAVRVANIPLEDFEAAIESDNPPTLSQLAAAGTNTIIRPPGFAQATEAIGTLRRFAEFCQKNDPTVVAHAVMAHETEGVQQHVSVIDAWLDRFVTNIGDTL